MKNKRKNFLALMLLMFVISWTASAQKDYKLWLQYDKIPDNNLRTKYLSDIQGIVFFGNSETTAISSKELETGLTDMLGTKISVKSKLEKSSIIIGSQNSLNSEI